MKTTLPAVALAAFTIFTGCSSLLQGADFAHKDLFRRQIAESLPVKEWGYKVQDIRLSDDTRKVLVVFLAPTGATNRDVLLNDDGFRRYTGYVIDLVRQAAAKSGDSSAWTTGIIVTLPDTLSAYPHDREFREQVEASIPVRKWGYKIQDIRFTADYKKALLTFNAAGKAVEATLEDDGFRRFLGAVPRPDGAKPPPSPATDLAQYLAFTAESTITVTLAEK
jgi:hypothetical protein